MRVTQQAPDGRKIGGRGQGGFTLIELLVVVAILAILAGIAMLSTSQLNHDAQVNGCKVERQTLIAAMQAADASNDPSVTFDQFTDSGIKYFDYGGDAANPVWTTKPGHPGPDCPLP